ncbi:MAG: response regulator [Flavobacteriales bacterium]|nr:response regulator [Flavobacteriales bacterium]
MEQANTEMSLGKPKILMVDDRPENLVALERIMKGMEVDLYRANSGNEALKLTLHHNFALALLDIQMPEMDGYELAEILRSEEKTARMPFIFVSAIYTDQIHVFRGYEKGAFSFITKPFEPIVLTSKIDFFVEKYQQEQMLVHTHKLLEKRVKELQSANQEMESFSYSVSHDLRAPLRAIDGFSQIILNKYKDQFDETGQRYLTTIADNAKKMGQLIDDILAFSKLGRQELSVSSFLLEQLFRDAYIELTGQSEYSETEIKIGDLSKVKGDPNLIKQVVVNLLSNAMKYSSKAENPSVEVGQLEKDGRTIFYVKDNGAGFDMKYYDKLFGVFQRLHRDSEFKGNGVGLALVSRIINRHNGEVWAESELGKGATFYFTLNDNKQPLTT